MMPMSPTDAQLILKGAEVSGEDLGIGYRRALETIAGMHEEYAVQVRRSGEWQYSRGEDDRWLDLGAQIFIADREHPDEETRIVRRYVTEPEEA